MPIVPFGPCVLLALALFLLASCASDAFADERVVVSNAAFRLEVYCAAGDVLATLTDLRSGRRLADGPVLYAATREGVRAEGLEGATARAAAGRLTVRGRLAGLELTQTFTAVRGRPWLEERIALRNPGRSGARLEDLAIGLGRPLIDAAGRPAADLAADRWIAVPFRHRATDPKGLRRDYGAADLGKGAGHGLVSGPEQWPQDGPRRLWLSEGWAWTHGGETVGLFRYCQEHLQFSALSPETGVLGTRLRFGGAWMAGGEPAALGRMAGGVRVDLGLTRYAAVRGGWAEAARAFRDLLDEKGCRFPADYNPPVHWEQLYNMEGAWNDRPHRYTLAAIEREAALGRAYGCEAIYLDPGWDTAFGTFLWGEDWLGPRRAFVDRMRREHGLELALHCPLATWMSGPLSWGIEAVESWPKAGLRRDPRAANGDPPPVPAVVDGRRNLALLPDARASASSVLDGGSWPIHQVAHLADGWYGNTGSWIAGTAPAWAEIDLGAAYRVGEVRLGNDHRGQYSDRAATRLRVRATEDESGDSGWTTVREVGPTRLAGTAAFAFSPVRARRIRVEILEAADGLPRLDEIEVLEADPAPPAEAAEHERRARRGPKPPPAGAAGPRVCLGSRQYIDEAAKRLIANCDDGAVFLMLDGNWWSGDCIDPDHGHPIPYRWEDHIRANLELARRVHARHPRVLIEMHDMIAGGSTARPTPVYYKYGLPGSFDENWGLELMWDPMADLREGRAEALYDYNLGCNIPVYLHIDLRKDNRACVVLWWYASTCRHLGIGGTHADPATAAAQQAAMRRYRELERFFKRGEFVGLSPQVHAHALPAENAVVLNLFNLSDTSRAVTAESPLASLGLDRAERYAVIGDGVNVSDGVLRVRREMAPWSAEVALVRPAR
ncbi:MAG: discoidin domain-containing protein [Chthonomonadales bacterium]|nr:discoidin domain-containing protein [Chthonomonadales bacterium]